MYNRAVFLDITTKSGNLGHNRDIWPNSGTVLAILGWLAISPVCLCGCSHYKSEWIKPLQGLMLVPLAGTLVLTHTHSHLGTLLVYDSSASPE